MQVLLKLVHKKSTEEYVVRVYENGVYREGPTYYAEDKQDARQTRAAMAIEYARQGHVVVMSGKSIKSV